jgi:hypothetical protein
MGSRLSIVTVLVVHIATELSYLCNFEPQLIYTVHVSMMTSGRVSDVFVAARWFHLILSSLLAYLISFVMKAPDASCVGRAPNLPSQFEANKKHVNSFKFM